MEQIRCLIADIQHLMLADIVQEIIETRPGIEVVARIKGKEGFPQLIKDQQVDVMILSKAASTLSNTLDELFNIDPQILVVDVMEGGRRVCVCVEDIGPAELIDMIQFVKKHKKNNKGLLKEESGVGKS